MEIKELKQLVRMITETDITEFEMESSEEKIVIKRGARTEYAVVNSPTVTGVPQASVAAPVAVSAAAAPAAVVAAESGETINSPIVGTFYAAPSPDAPPYVQVGQVVEKGQQLCIVEAMKLMNEIEAEFRCRIVRIFKDNAQAVEYGDPLFVIERL